ARRRLEEELLRLVRDRGEALRLRALDDVRAEVEPAAELELAGGRDGEVPGRAQADDVTERGREAAEAGCGQDAREVEAERSREADAEREVEREGDDVGRRVELQPVLAVVPAEGRAVPAGVL